MSRFEEPFNDDECDLPPFGWRCTRGKGHEGPCAAMEEPEAIAFVERGMKRYRDGVAKQEAAVTTFAEAWGRMVKRGYQYSDSNVEKVRMGWDLAMGVLANEAPATQQAAKRLLAGLAAATVSDHGYHDDIRTVIRAALAAPTQAAGAYCGFCGGTDHKAIDCLDTHCPVEERAKRIAALAASTQAAPAAQAKVLTEYQIDQVFNWHNRVHGPVNAYTAARRFARAIELALAAAPAAAVGLIKHDPTEVYEMPFEARARRLARERAAAVQPPTGRGADRYFYEAGFEAGKRAAAVPEGLTFTLTADDAELLQGWISNAPVAEGSEVWQMLDRLHIALERPASDDAKVATHSCPWCGARVPEDDDCPQPPDVCHHEVVIKDQAAKG